MKRLIAVVAIVFAALLGGPATAWAHNTLVSSDPADGARLGTGPRQVRLVFDQPVRAGYDTVNVIGPNGDYWTDGKASVEGNAVTAPVRELGPKGTYTVAYRVLSNDGHPVTGEIRFTLTRAGQGTPAPPPADQADPADQESGMPIWPWIAGAVVLVVLGAVLAARLGRSGDD